MTNPQPPSDSDRLRAALADDFEILEELGRGGMAIVFRARDKALGRDVAIKVLPAHLMKDSALVERFEHEARTAGNLEHPNIIPIHSVGRAGARRDVSYFVMKLLRGESLSDVLRKRGKLPADELETLLVEVASALGYAAKHDVVHRDIKPDNILFDSEGRAVLTDFGIAKTPGGHHSAAGMLVGSPRYMSPEHALSQPLDGRSDLYSLGVVAYESLVGRPPFDADDPLEIIYKHIHEPPPAPALRTAEERKLYRVIARMLAKSPGDRFQTAHDVVVALGGHLAPHTSANDPAATAPVATLSVAPTEPAVPVVPAAAGPVLAQQPEPWTMRRGAGWVAAAAIAAVLLGPPAIASMRDKTRPQPAATISKVEMPAPSKMPAATPPAITKTAPADTTTRASTRAVVAAPVLPPKPKLKPPPKPSARAAAILAYNRLKSSCAKRDTLVSAKPIEYAVLMDSLPDRSRGNEMAVVYDVCGLSAGSSFTAKFTLTKLRQRGFGQQKPHVATTTEKAGSPRSRERWTLDIREMSAGSYRLEVVVTEGADRVASASREFKITDK